jgi:hypothetical protein
VEDKAIWLGAAINEYTRFVRKILRRALHYLLLKIVCTTLANDQIVAQIFSTFIIVIKLLQQLNEQ